MNEPKPCPFCGHPPKAWNWKQSYELSCENEHCPANPGVEANTCSAAVDLWNTRLTEIDAAYTKERETGEI